MIYCVDIDGTICSLEEDPSKAKPFKERIKIINDLYDQGNWIIYETARGSVTGIDWRDKTAKQLKKWGAKYNQLRTGVKIYANWYIDDRAFEADEFFLCE